MMSSIALKAQAPPPPVGLPGGPGGAYGEEEKKSKKTGKEFTTSVIYGIMAGTLVGAATLAFTSNPGGNLNNVARGASYGLYAGILLGAYATYSDDEEERPARQSPSIYESPAPGEDIGAPPGPPLDGGPPPEGNIQKIKFFAGLVPDSSLRLNPSLGFALKF